MNGAFKSITKVAGFCEAVKPHPVGGDRSHMATLVYL